MKLETKIKKVRAHSSFFRWYLKSRFSSRKLTFKTWDNPISILKNGGKTLPVWTTRRTVKCLFSFFFFQVKLMPVSVRRSFSMSRKPKNILIIRDKKKKREGTYSHVFSVFHNLKKKWETVQVKDPYLLPWHHHAPRHQTLKLPTPCPFHHPVPSRPLSPLSLQPLPRY